jgi:hypothetical protein
MMPDEGSNLARTNAELHIQFSLSSLAASSLYGLRQVNLSISA